MRKWALTSLLGLLAGCAFTFNPPVIERSAPGQEFFHPDNRVITLDVPAKANEVTWSAKLAEKLQGQAEYRLPDRSRIDVLTEEHAIEVDWHYKWHEAIGQSLHYASFTGKKPIIALGIKESLSPTEKQKLEVAVRVANGYQISVWVLLPTE